MDARANDDIVASVLAACPTEESISAKGIMCNAAAFVKYGTGRVLLREAELPSMQESARSEFTHRAHGRESLHFVFLDLQGRHATSALDRWANRRARISRRASWCTLLTGFSSMPRFAMQVTEQSYFGQLGRRCLNS